MAANETVGINLRMNHKEIEKELKTIDDRLKKLKTNKTTIELRAEKLQNAKNEIQKVNVQLKELSAKKALIKADTTDIEKGKKQISEINEQMNKLRARKAILQVSTEKLKGADREAKNLSKEMTSLNNRKAILQVDAEDAVKAEEQMGRLTSKIQEVNTTKATISLSSAMNDIGGGLQGAGDKLLSLNPLNSVAGKFLGLGAAVKLVDSGINQLRNSVGGAIARFDTMEKYPKVMQALGFAADQSETSIQTLSDGIDGLPTTLDDIVAANQRMVSTTGNIEKGTKATIALNNAFLASGADYEKASRGTDQFMKMLSRGEPDLVSWRTMMDTMPVSLTKLANAFGYAGESAQMDLYDALNAGTYTFDEFQDKLIELGTGTGELAELARTNSEGIATSFENLKNSTTKGMANLLGEFSKTVEAVTGKNIPQHLDSLKGIINGVFDNINANMDKTKPFIEKGAEMIATFVEKVKAFDWKSFFSGVKEGFNEVKNAGMALYNTFIKPILKVLGKGDMAKGLGKLPFQLFLLGHGLKFAGGAFKLLGGGLSILEKMNKFKGFNIPFLKGDGAQKASPKVDLLNNLKGTASSLANGAKNLVLVYGAIKVAEAAAEAMKQLDEKIPDDFFSLARKIGAMSLGIGAIGLLAVVAGKIPTGELVKGLATIALVSLEIMLAAEAIKQLDQKIPDDFMQVVNKIGTMALAIGAMTLLTGVVGLIASIGAPILIAGLVTVAAVSLEIMLAAEAIKQLDEKVPDSMGDVAKKIGSLAIAIGGITALDVALGAGALVFGPLIGLGALITGVVSAEIVVAAEALKQLNEKVPNDFGEIEGKLETMISSLLYIAGSDLGSLGTAFTSLVSKFSSEKIVEVLDELLEAAEKLTDFQEFQLDSKTIESNVQAIQKITEKLTTNRFLDIFKDKIDVGKFAAFKEATDELVAIVKNLRQLEGNAFNAEEVETTILNIEKVLAAIRALGEEGNIEALNGVTEAINQLVESLNGLTGEFKTAGNEYGKALVKGFKNANVPKKIIDIVDKLITNLKDKTERFREIGKGYGDALKDGFTTGSRGLNSVINTQIAELQGKTGAFRSLGTSFGNAIKNSFESAIAEMETSINKLKNKVEKIPALPSQTASENKPDKKPKNNSRQVAYFSEGGFVPRGTDTVPAMLTAGEYVQSKQAVSVFGKDFMDKVNNLDIQGALKQTYSRFDTQAMYHAPVINNIHNVSTTNNANVTQHVQQAAPDYSMKRAAFSLQQLT